MYLPIFILLALFAVPVLAEESGDTIYAQQCAACHGRNGEGMQYVAPPLKNVDFLKTASMEEVKEVIRAGRAGVDKKHSAFPSVMPPFPNLSDEDAIAVAKYVLGALQEK